MNEDWMDPWQREMWKEMVASSHPGVPLPPIIAYFVGGPADGQERVVHPGETRLQWGEVLPLEPRRIMEDRLVISPVPSYRMHTYAPCPETGEWLWQGVR